MKNLERLIQREYELYGDIPESRVEGLYNVVSRKLREAGLDGLASFSVPGLEGTYTLAEEFYSGEWEIFQGQRKVSDTSVQLWILSWLISEEQVEDSSQCSY